MPKASAGILLYARDGSAVRVFLAHPGGPFWRHRDESAWSIPKGGIASGETAQAAALREFQEELGQVPPGKLQPLGRIRQPGGKRVEAFALEGDFDTRNLRSNLFELERPPRSGATRAFPEVDRAAWFDLAEARVRMLGGQRPLLDCLEALLKPDMGRPAESARCPIAPSAPEQGMRRATGHPGSGTASSIAVRGGRGMWKAR